MLSSILYLIITLSLNESIICSNIIVFIAKGTCCTESLQFGRRIFRRINYVIVIPNNRIWRTLVKHIFVAFFLCFVDSKVIMKTCLLKLSSNSEAKASELLENLEEILLLFYMHSNSPY